ncbi:eae-like protein [Escherichia coli]|uniref:hypothetical protein n=1 Tax=Escherichia coli TaxID=562 RepID=UPI00067DB186|nr:hypothetical protein [Escherichia coli]EET2437976.1 eae-like protein [Escherichia coli]EET4794444.1 eae-like protein [Escherichia coli]EEX5382727.1 eae-like protein [Escherichia coli]EFA7268615.1 eae-like protein [Escherichia coli]EFL3919360.1 eae-like protein [Escherichia coli]
MKSEGLTQAQLAERNANYVTEITLHEKERAVLALENAWLKHAMVVALEHVSVTDAGQAGVVARIINSALHNSKTLAPYALLAELRAQGVEMVREHPSIKLCSLTHICDELAAELRRGGNQ